MQLELFPDDDAPVSPPSPPSGSVLLVRVGDLLMPVRDKWENGGFGGPGPDDGYTFACPEYPADHKYLQHVPLESLLEDVPDDSPLWLTPRQLANMAKRLRRSGRPVWPELEEK